VAELGAALTEFAPSGRVHVERARRVLQAAEGHRPSSVAPGPISSDSPTIQASVSAVALWSQLSGRERRRRWGVVLAAALAVVVAGLAVLRKQLPLAGGEKSVATDVARAAPTVTPVATPVVVAAPSEPVAPTKAEPIVPASAEPVATAETAPSTAPGTTAKHAPQFHSRPVSATAAKATDSSAAITDFGGRR
jgi:cell pole-organizing protein PopZ